MPRRQTREMDSAAVMPLAGFVGTGGNQLADAAARCQMLLASHGAEAVRFVLRTTPRCFVPGQLTLS
jgi:hypothetical protein